MGQVGHDVIVIGLGGMGSAAAAHLAARGQRVLGLERFTPAHDQGSSHGGSRVIRQSYFEDPAYVPLLLRAYELWEQLDEDGEPVHRLTGGVYVGPETSQTFAGSLLASRQWDLPHEVLSAAELTRRFPAFAPPADHLALVEEKGGYARPEATVRAHLARAAAHGAELRFGETVRSWRDDGDHVTVVTDAGTYVADRLVVAPGAWAPRLLADLDVPVTIERQVMYWIGASAGTGPMVDGPVYVSETEVGEQIYGFPAIDGPDGGAKVAFFRKGSTCDPESIDRSVSEAEREAMRERVQRLLPGLDGPVLRAATCMYSTTPDQHFVIAPHPEHPRVVVACGFSGHGFKFVPVVGEILADLAIDGATAHPIDLFDPRRAALV